MADKLSESDFVPVPQHPWLVWDETLAVKMRSVNAAQIDQGQRIFSAPNSGMNARNTLFLRTERCEVQTQCSRCRAAAVVASQHHLLLRLQDHRVGGVADMDNN